MAAAISPIIAIVLLAWLVFECRKKGRQILAAFLGAAIMACFPVAAVKMQELLVWAGSSGAKLAGETVSAIFRSVFS